MEVVIQDRKARHRHREDFRKFVEPALDPDLAVVGAFTQQGRAAHAPRDAVVPA